MSATFPDNHGGPRGRWLKVTKEQPCPRCGHDNWCRISPDGQMLWCGRESSSAIKGSGGGWLHALKELPKQPLVPAVPRRAAPRSPSKAFATAEAAIAAAGRRIKGGTLTATWTYQDASGAEVMHVARFDLADGAKEFRPVHRAKAGWKIGDPSGKLPLYRLPELRQGGQLYVLEGEKATDAARAIGLVATTSAHGSSAADRSDWTPAAGQDVIILPDADEAGARYARDVATILAKLEPPARVKVLTLPLLAEGEDLVEFIAARPGATPAEVRAEIEALANQERWIEPSSIIGGPVLLNMADIEAREIHWLWPGRIALGRITLIVGKPGEGKSYVTCDAAARVTTGTPWPDGADCPSGSVILVCAEDDPADTIRPRLDAHHADVRRIRVLSAVRHLTADGKAREVMFTLADVTALETALKQTPDCKMVVIDPIGSFLGGGTDAHRDNEVRSVLAPVARLAERYGVAVLIVAHRRKSSGSSADELALGSRAFTGIARAVWHLSRDPANPLRRFLLPGKNNLGPEGDGLAFSIIGTPTGAVVWEREPVRMSADEALAAEQGGGRDKPGPEPAARIEAAEWLRCLLQEGPVPSKQVEAEADAAGLARRTVRRAADDLGVKRERCPFSKAWQWRLPSGSDAGLEAIQARLTTDDLDNLDNIAISPEIGASSATETATCPSSSYLANSTGANGDGRVKGEL